MSGMDRIGGPGSPGPSYAPGTATGSPVPPGGYSGCPGCKALVRERDDALRQLENALSYSKACGTKALKERDEARKANDRLLQRAKRAESEAIVALRMRNDALDVRDEARKLLDDLCEIVAGESPHPNGRSQQIIDGLDLKKVVTMADLLRERHASWEGWNKR